MDVALKYSDEYFFTPYVYPKSWPEEDLLRQFLSLNVIVDVGGTLLYLITASLSWFFIFDSRLLQHPKALENQVQREITFTLQSIPFMGLPTAALFLLEVRGYSRLYDSVDEARFGWWSIAGTLLTFIMFTDFIIYWIHRWLHHPLIYKNIHKPHHQWKVPSPFASHAFHPLDGFAQSLPYHIYVFLFPMHKFVYLLLYVLVNMWTVSIHDGDYRVPKFLKPFINGSAHHMDHHVYYNYNYGQYFTLWDRIGGSFRYPTAYEGNGPLDQVKKMQDGKLGKKAQ
ncbi:Lathosterol oxidase [Lamellibrachia satsuma]|nr:Lathosterol oxidase [Lamellibrachia satsuma]